MRQVINLTLVLLPAVIAPLYVQAEAFNEFVSKLKTFVVARYPEAQFDIAEHSITFRYNTREFMIHEAYKTGEWQEARAQEGPNPLGILGKVQLDKGPYLGAALVPQSFNKRYFTVLVQAPYFDGCDCHIHSRLFYTSKTDRDFVRKYAEIIDEFSKKTYKGR